MGFWDANATYTPAMFGTYYNYRKKWNDFLSVFLVDTSMAIMFKRGVYSVTESEFYHNLVHNTEVLPIILEWIW